MLTRDSVTVASRVMLPAYVVLAAVYGMVYIFDPLGRLKDSHALAFPRAVMGGTMVPWGFLFLGVAVFLAAMLRTQSRRGYVFGLCVFAAAWAAWAVMYGISIFTDPQTSVLAPVGPLFYFTAAIASALSLLTRET